MLDRNERQDLGIRKWVNANCRGTLVWATGVGKTRAGIKAIKLFLTRNKNKKIVIVVPTEHLKVQWMQELAKQGLFHDATVEIINSAAKVQEKVDFILLDECHRYAADLFYEIFNMRNPSIVLGLSATFNRLDGKHELLEKFCPVCDTITIKEAIENKWLSPYKEYKVLLHVSDIADYKFHNQQFLDSFAMFGFDFQVAMNCLTNIIYRRAFAKKMGMTAAEIDAVTFTWNRSLKARKSFVMNHPLKVDITRKILEARKDKKAITFSATIKQAEKIGGGYLVHSGKTKKKNHLTMAEFSSLETGVIHTAKSMDEGVDIKGLNLAIILCNSSSQTQKTQRVGRVIRYEEGKEAEIFTLVIAETNEESWYQNSTAGKEYIEITESELDDILYGEGTDRMPVVAEERGLLFRL